MAKKPKYVSLPTWAEDFIKNLEEENNQLATENQRLKNKIMNLEADKRFYGIIN